jgi:hypothetical protein
VHGRRPLLDPIIISFLGEISGFSILTYFPRI